MRNYDLSSSLEPRRQNRVAAIARRRPRRSFAALAGALALAGGLALAAEPSAGAAEPLSPVVARAASQRVAVPAVHEAPPIGPSAAGREIRGGEASYYHDSLAGNPTASGTPYRPAALTAAHRTLPLGTRLRVTELDSGRSVVVEVNDRGPFAKDRVIDLSRAAAQEIGIIERGHADVHLELLG